MFNLWLHSCSTKYRQLVGVVDKVGTGRNGKPFLIIQCEPNLKVYYGMRPNDEFKVGDRVNFDIRPASRPNSLPFAYNLRKI